MDALTYKLTALFAQAVVLPETVEGMQIYKSNNTLVMEKYACRQTFSYKQSVKSLLPHPLHAEDLTDCSRTEVLIAKALLMPCPQEVGVTFPVSW